MKEKQLEKIRHSLAHLLALVILNQYPNAKLGIGPTIENGFYYDFYFKNKKPKEEELKKIEKEIKNLIKKDLKFKKEKISYQQAKKIFKNQPFKLELINELKKNKKPITIYLTFSKDKKINFIDLCQGPHIKSTKEIPLDSFLLEKMAGAYWKGSEKNPMLLRIYGLAFENKNKLNKYLELKKEAEKRDHKKIGPQLELFFFDETAPGMAYWLPKGVVIFNELVNFWREEHQKRGYQEIKTPLLNKKELYEISGHWKYYKEDMFLSETKENEIYALKPMNCPNAMIVYKTKIRSYKDLPLRFSDTDPLHRYERSGTLSGLLRAREFSQDDAHIFIAQEQIKSEYQKIFEITERFYSIFNLSYSFRLGTRPKKFMGDIKTWNKAEKVLTQILKESKKPYFILKGDGAFYGPKIDILMKDSLGRDWQMGTIQLDFQIPKRFNLKYIDKNGKEKTPIVIHRVIYGSLERFIGILTEHFKGSFPLWLSPIQVKIIPVSEKHLKYSQEIFKKLINQNIRAEIAQENQTVSKRVREAEIEKIPYIIVLGDKEVKNKTLTIRQRDKKNFKTTKLNLFIKEILKKIENKK